MFFFNYPMGFFTEALNSYYLLKQNENEIELGKDADGKLKIYNYLLIAQVIVWTIGLLIQLNVMLALRKKNWVNRQKVRQSCCGTNSPCCSMPPQEVQKTPEEKKMD